MDGLVDISAAGRAVRLYARAAEDALSPELFDRLEKLIDSPSPVDMIVGTAEMLYANRGDIDDAGRTLLAQLASFAAVNGWHGMSVGNRGGLIAQAMRRDLGLKTLPGQPKPQKIADDPEPIATYLIERVPVVAKTAD